MAYVRFPEKSISRTYPRISSLWFACICHILEAQGTVKVQNRFMGSYSEDMAFTLSQIQIQDLGITADTPNIHPSMLVHVLNQRHLIQSYNMQATQRNMPANHGNVQATHGNMPATHAYNNWQVNLFDRMGGEEL